MTATRASAAIAVALVTTATGCTDPYARRPPSTVAGEQPAPPVRRGPGAAESLATRADVVRRAVALTGTWTGATVARRYAALARISVGEARATARQTAAQIPRDAQLTAPGSTSRATIGALQLRGRRFVVATREGLAGDGRVTTHWRVTTGAVRRHGRGWVLSRWEPQP